MADIVLKDGNGNPVTYEGVTKVSLPTAAGGTITFGGGVEAETVVVDGGRFTPSAQKMTINHYLGAVPDFIFIGQLDAQDIIDRNGGQISWALGWSRRILDMDRVSVRFNAFINMVCIDEPDGDTNVIRGKYTNDEGIDETGTLNPGYGMIRAANSTSFTVGRDDGADKWSLHTRVEYYWFAISGLGIRMNPVDEV